MKTNLKAIRHHSILLAYAVPIKIDEYSVISHPFINFPITVIKDNKFVNLLDNKERDEWFRYLSDIINTSDLLHIYMMVNKPYKLTWLKFCRPYMSEKEFAEYLADAWTIMENPNQDINVDISTLIYWFGKYPKEHLMTKEDKHHLESLPEDIVLYRGVGKMSNPYGLSYTSSLKKAKWFQKRFDNNGFLIALKVKKNDVLAYFSTRGESEFIVNTNKYKKKIKEQIQVIN